MLGILWDVVVLAEIQCSTFMVPVTVSCVEIEEIVRLLNVF